MILQINESQIRKVAKILKDLPESGNGLNFYSYKKDGKEIVDSEKFPPLNHPQAINFFFFAVMQDFGFWYGDDKGYTEPLYGVIEGKEVKGSDLSWKACAKALYRDSTLFKPEVLKDITPWELARIFSDDRGPIPFPDFEIRFKMARAYGQYFVDDKINPVDIVQDSNKQEEPLRSFLSWLRLVPGYDEDFLQKKNLLLAMALANRPEKFLKVKDPQNWRPIVDYHLMRVSLRLSLIDIGKEERERNIKREWTSAEEERIIRLAVYDAVRDLIELSGRPMSFIDEKMWMAREYCPEMRTPDCSKCIFDSICKKRVELFQPVFRTTVY